MTHKEYKKDLLELIKKQKKSLEDSQRFAIRNAKSFGPSKRFYFDFFLCGTATEGQLDSGADVSLISLNLIEMICPDWKRFPQTERLKITGVSGSPVKVIDRRIFPVSLSPNPEEEFSHPFLVVEEPDLLLLSSQAMYSKSLGISWDKSGEKPLPHMER